MAYVGHLRNPTDVVLAVGCNAYDKSRAHTDLLRWIGYDTQVAGGARSAPLPSVERINNFETVGF